MGADLYHPKYCDCSTDIGTSYECNLFNLMSGTIFYKREDAAINYKSDMIHYIELISKHKSYKAFNRAAYLGI